MPEEQPSLADMAACDCPTCERKRGLASSIHSGVIHSYSSQPRGGWSPRRTPAELAEGRMAPTFGVELETAVANPFYGVPDLAGQPQRPNVYDYADRYSDPAYVAAAEAYNAAYGEWTTRNRAHHRREAARIEAIGNLTAEEAVSVASPRGLWHAKHDGSVSGPEFASQPATLAFWRSQRNALSGMCKALLHGGVRSHDGDTCGLHVNVGNDAFGDADHLYRFATLMVVNPRWTTRMAQRTHDSIQHWSRFTPLADAATRRAWAAEVVRRGSAYQERYSVLNAQNPGRIEVRVPRGTLRVDRFYAKLEWIASLIEYTRDASRPVRISDYMRWAVGTGEYPELARYFGERFPKRLDRATAEVAA